MLREEKTMKSNEGDSCWQAEEPNRHNVGFEWKCEAVVSKVTHIIQQNIPIIYMTCGCDPP